MFRRRGPASAEEDPLIISPVGSPGPAPGLKARRGNGPRLRTLAGAAAALLLCWALWTGRLELHLSPTAARAGTLTGSANGSSLDGLASSAHAAADGAAAGATAAGVQQQQLAAAAPRHKRQLADGSWAPTLLVYVFSNTDPEYLNNLRFFVRCGGRGKFGGQQAAAAEGRGGGSVRRRCSGGAQGRSSPAHAAPISSAAPPRLLAAGLAWRRTMA